ncbi:glycosyltransferase [Hymenobacter taeanensis]|uniref:Glycosyltransferase n=1 Tax=Hymenobacter taeanensis TaxID=2735321 RepID=A0A6M6BPZ8_9BACT|nr:MULTISPECIES: glycosyltransferase [Hymenobacter]QJX49055.1 glycosyltransferase [Hymenobacter taeanensis]UOQ81426.1 glycosyltransferase [Hymenobacter sp. 5414T-23]
MIPVYNCANYLPETLHSVLQQQLPEHLMQIEVIDDASSDADVEEIVNRIGKGRVKYYRQSENVGSLHNFATSIRRAQGQLIHLLHGDDRIRPGYYQEIGALFNQYPEIGAAYCRFGYIDEYGKLKYTQAPEMRQSGILEDYLLRIGERNRIQYASITVKRETYEKLGAFYGTTYGEDWEMWVRIAQNYSIGYSPNILADYRHHTNSISGNKHVRGEYLIDLTSVMNQIQQYLPQYKRASVLKRSKIFYSHYAIRQANNLWHLRHDKESTFVYIRQVLLMHRDLSLYLKILKLLVKVAINRR